MEENSLWMKRKTFLKFKDIKFKTFNNYGQKMNFIKFTGVRTTTQNGPRPKIVSKRSKHHSKKCNGD
jgi:hypothetical protein